MAINHNVELTYDDKGGPHLYYQPADNPNRWYECFDFGDARGEPGWVVLGWDEFEGDDLTCVEAYDDFGHDFKAAMAKFYEIVRGV